MIKISFVIMILSVIIPIYKVEHFIEKCAISLMEQTIKDVEYIFIDDCSPDNSISILKDVLSHYPQRKVQILTHQENKGLPAARNTGLLYATGKYVFHCDSDDFLEHDALQLLVETAEQKYADVVWCDWFLSFGHNARYMKQPDYATAKQALRGMLLGKMKYNVWNKLVRRNLYIDNHICFPTGYGMGEDMTMIRLMACAKQVAYIPQALYHYVKRNGEAFTNSFTQRKFLDIEHNIRQTIDFVQSLYGNQLEKEILCFKLNVKYPLLMTDDISLYRKWLEWFPESNFFVLKNTTASLRCKILQFAALKKQYWILRLHYELVYRFIYGFIYR